TWKYSCNIANLDITPFVNAEPSAKTQAPIVITSVVTTEHDPDVPIVAIIEILDNKNIVADHELVNNYDVRGQLKTKERLLIMETNVQDI
ncbi:hypothetical protein HK096_006675, partial [Nowakowskiella sp. JEL0078]